MIVLFFAAIVAVLVAAAPMPLPFTRVLSRGMTVRARTHVSGFSLEFLRFG